MPFQSKFDQLRGYFGIWKPEDWCDIRPESILKQDGIGMVTLNHLRLYLAARGLTLKNDMTPSHWAKNLNLAKIGEELGDHEEGRDKADVSPFTILIDTAEQQPFSFTGLRGDAQRDGRPWIVQTRWESLGRHPDSLGDYSLDGFKGRCHVERKSLEDCQGTILGFGGRRERFEQELRNLSRVEAAMVVVEATFLEVVQRAPETPNKTARQNAKTLNRSILAYLQDYRVPWLFCSGRRHAEVATFRFLERFWRKRAKEEKAMERLVAAI